VAQPVGDGARHEERADERAEQVERGVLARGDLLVAGARHLRGLRQHLLDGEHQAVRLARQRRRPAPPHPADLTGHDGGHRGARHHPQRKRAAIRDQRAAPPPAPRDQSSSS
jgi:hypothetical protein